MKTCSLRSLIVTVLILWSGLLFGEASLQALIDEGQLVISQNLQPENPVVGEEVTLAIEISTNRWFAGGTRLKPEQNDAMLVLQRQQLATNSSALKAGATWVVQLWELSLFPQHEGLLFTPQVDLLIKINTESGVVEGTYQLPSLPLTVSLPAALAAIDNRVASPAFSVERRFDRELQGLQAGDAFTMTIELRAENTLAMMLPAIKLAAIDGLAIYPQSPVLINDSNRGNKIAIRTETINFVVEKNGSYQLPAMRFAWWNTQANSLQEEQLEAVDFSSSGAMAPLNNKTVNLENLSLASTWKIVLALMLVVIIAALVYLFTRIGQPSIPSAKQAQRYFNQALKKNNSKLAIRWAYFWLDHYSGDKQAVTLRQYLAQLDNDPTSDQRQGLEMLFAGAFNERSERPANLQWKILKRKKPNKKQTLNPLQINP